MARLMEHEFVFCTALHEKMKEKVRGKVYTTVKDDILTVEIHMGYTDFVKTFDNFSNMLHIGVTTSDIVRAVTIEYRRFLNDNLEQRYFR